MYTTWPINFKRKQFKCKAVYVRHDNIKLKNCNLHVGTTMPNYRLRDNNFKKAYS